MASGLSRLFFGMKSGDWIAKAIEMAYARERAEHWDPPTLEVHPSSAGAACPRDIQLYMLGYRDSVTAKGLRRMNNGTYSHDRWTKYFADMGILHEANRRYTIDGEWSGECDLLLTHPVTGRPVLVEIKTMNERRFNLVPAQVDDRQQMATALAKIEPSYVRQLTHYWTMFRAKWPEISEECAFLFENTNTQDYKIRYITPNQEHVRDAFMLSTVARQASAEGHLLGPPYKMQSATCRKCYREGVCYALQHGDPEHTAAVEAALREVESHVVRVGEDELDPSPGSLVGAAGHP